MQMRGQAARIVAIRTTAELRVRAPGRIWPSAQLQRRAEAGMISLRGRSRLSSIVSLTRLDLAITAVRFRTL